MTPDAIIMLVVATATNGHAEWIRRGVDERDPAVVVDEQATVVEAHTGRAAHACASLSTRRPAATSRTASTTSGRARTGTVTLVVITRSPCQRK